MCKLDSILWSSSFERSWHQWIIALAVAVVMRWFIWNSFIIIVFMISKKFLFRFFEYAKYAKQKSKVDRI